MFKVSYARSLPRQIFLPLLISSRIPQCCKQEAALPWHAESWFFCPWLGVYWANSSSCESTSYRPSALGSRAPTALAKFRAKEELSPKRRGAEESGAFRAWLSYILASLGTSFYPPGSTAWYKNTPSNSGSPVKVAPLGSAQHLPPSFTYTKPWRSRRAASPRGQRPDIGTHASWPVPRHMGLGGGEAPPAWPLAFCMVAALKGRHTLSIPHFTPSPFPNILLLF